MDLSHAQELFAREYSALFDVVYRYVVSRLPNRDEAQDIVSEAFTKAYARLSEFDPEKGSLRQWLIGIAKYELLTHWRSQKNCLLLEEDQLPVDASTEIPLDQSLDQQMFAEKIYQCLSASSRILLTLRYVDGLSYEELAEVTGKEASALRQHFSRLHRSLRLQFHDQSESLPL